MTKEEDVSRAPRSRNSTISTQLRATSVAEMHAPRATSENSWRAGQADLKVFAAWTAANDLVSLPALPGTAARILREQADYGKQVATLARYAQALSVEAAAVAQVVWKSWITRQSRSWRQGPFRYAAAIGTDTPEVHQPCDAAHEVFRAASRVVFFGNTKRCADFRRDKASALSVPPFSAG